jgi:hypothetical protein
VVIVVALIVFGFRRLRMQRRHADQTSRRTLMASTKALADRDRRPLQTPRADLGRRPAGPPLGRPSLDRPFRRPATGWRLPPGYRLRWWRDECSPTARPGPTGSAPRERPCALPRERPPSERRADRGFARRRRGESLSPCATFRAKSPNTHQEICSASNRLQCIGRGSSHIRWP